MHSFLAWAAALTLFSSNINATPLLFPRQANTTSCPGYKASDVSTTANGLTAKLTLAGTPCNLYGTDIEDLTLTVEYQTGMLPTPVPMMERPANN
jgi:alpha-glucosidase